jgi:hypothetical protein
VTAGTGERFVATANIRTAVKGRETELLDVLGILWRAGRPHINCPYPDHSDKNPSWRWDEQKRCAICTCGSDSILKVLIKVEGISFEAAKIRAAEILGRQDLIRIRTGGERYQRQDAYSLLNPPADNRDDELPFVYLGSRLGLEPGEIPRPFTPVVGLRRSNISIRLQARERSRSASVRTHALSSAPPPRMAESTPTEFISVGTAERRRILAPGRTANSAIPKNQPGVLTLRRAPRDAGSSGAIRNERRISSYLRVLRTPRPVPTRFVLRLKQRKSTSCQRSTRAVSRLSFLGRRHNG